MYVEQRAFTRIENRRYVLRAEKDGERRGFAVEVIRDANPYDTIEEYQGFADYLTAQAVYLMLVRTAMHHSGADMPIH